MTEPPLRPGDAAVLEAAILVVGDVRIDLRYRRVMRPDGHSELPQRMFDLLQVFLAEPGVLQTRDALFERVWPGVVVEDSNLSQSVWMLRKALGEPRKHWIRTVSKRGYVFEPPGPVRAEPAPAAQASPEVGVSPIMATLPETVVHVDAAQSVQPRRPRALAIVPALALIAMWSLLLAALMPGPPSQQKRTPLATTHAALDIVLLQADTRSDANRNAGSDDRHDGDVARVPVVLLDAWLSWKLDLLPEVVRRDTLPPRDGRTSPRVVVLSSDAVPGTREGVVLHARIGGGTPGAARDAPEIVLSERGTRAELPTLVDTLSRRVIARLLPHRADERWPALSLPADVAARHAAAVDAMHRRDWARARTEAQAVATAAPTFAPAHLALSELALRSNQTRDALAHAGMARRGLAPLPADALRILDAQFAAIDPRRQSEAAEAQATLAREFPQRADLALTHVRLLLRAGDPHAAQARLDDAAIDWTRESLDRRIRRQLLSTDIAGMRGDIDGARAQAQRTLAELARLGPGWTGERGMVRMQLARVHHGEAGRTPSPSLFELAAAEFESAGDTLAMRYARYLADEARRGDASGITPSMRALREEARRAGNAAIETEMLRREAYKHYNAGSHGEYRRLLRDALEVANASGDTALQDALELDLLNQDALVGNHASAKARIARLSRGTHTDERVYWAAEFDAILHLRGGDLASARAALARVERRLTARGQALPRPIAVRLACVRGDLDLVRGDVASARRHIDACRHAEDAYLRQWSQILDAQADLLEGDPAQARVHLAQIERAIDTMPRGTDHWIMVETVAALLARVGEYDRAERLYSSALQRCEAAGYELLAMSMRIGLAEIAMARGDRARSRAIADAARRQAPPDLWALQRRLDTLELLDTLHAGDSAQARARWTQLHDRARRHDDGVLLAELESLAREAGFDEAVGVHRETTPPALPGATLDWLSAGPSR